MAIFQQAYEFKDIINVHYNQQTLPLQGKIPTPRIWAITKIIVSTLTLVVSSRVLNIQYRGYQFMNDALANAINLE